ncbi:hypothetical protein C8J33_1231, partial [Rhizobium sp. PP-CC-3G-465]
MSKVPDKALVSTFVPVFCNSAQNGTFSCPDGGDQTRNADKG